LWLRSQAFLVFWGDDVDRRVCAVTDANSFTTSTLPFVICRAYRKRSNLVTLFAHKCLLQQEGVLSAKFAKEYFLCLSCLRSHRWPSTLKASFNSSDVIYNMVQSSAEDEVYLNEVLGRHGMLDVRVIR
jgi:hypothetical protein